MQPANNKSWRIYVLGDPRNGLVRYVGITTVSIAKRLRCHLADARRGAHNHRANWIRSLLSEGMRPSVNVVAVGAGEWEKAEQWWIAHLRSLGLNLTNGTIGGGGKLGHIPSDESRAKLSATTKGRHRFGDPASFKHTEATREKIAAAGMGRVFSAESRQKKSQSLKGRAPSEAVLCKVRGVPKSLEHRRKLSESVSGERHPNVKLTAVQVLEIRRRRKCGEYTTTLAREFSVSTQNIQSICTGQSWKHLPA